MLATRPWSDFTAAVSEDSAYAGERDLVGAWRRSRTGLAASGSYAGSVATVEQTTGLLEERGMP